MAWLRTRRSFRSAVFYLSFLGLENFNDANISSVTLGVYAMRGELMQAQQYPTSWYVMWAADRTVPGIDCCSNVHHYQLRLACTHNKHTPSETFPLDSIQFTFNMHREPNTPTRVPNFSWTPTIESQLTRVGQMEAPLTPQDTGRMWTSSQYIPFRLDVAWFSSWSLSNVRALTSTLTSIGHVLLSNVLSCCFAFFHT